MDDYMESKLKEAHEMYEEYKPEKVGSTFKDLTGQKFGRLLVLYRTKDKISPCGMKATA